MKKTDIIEEAMRYRQIIILITTILVLFGCYALYKMPKQEFPTFTIRQGLVVGVYPGATSAQVEEQLTKPLENFIFSYKEVKKKKTFSQSRDGIVFINVELNDDVTNKDEFWSKFKHGLASFKNQLPSGVLALQANDDFGDTSALLITLESEDKTYRELENYLDKLESRIRKIESVANLRRYGLQKEQISVYLDQKKLSAYGIGNNTLTSILLTQGFTALSGSIDNSEFVAPIHISETYNSEKEISEQIVYSDANGNVIRLKDIARIVREYPDPDSYIKNNGKKCILLSLEMREGNNIVSMGDEVNKVLKEYQQELPKDVRIYRITDQPQVVSDSVTTFLKELLIAILAVILIVILLMPLRVASVAASTIPITIFISLGIFFTCGIELNTVTLAALIVTLGMIVDNSIVIIDCYMEKLDQGFSRWYSAITSAKEFFKSILSATLAISITFFPFLITTKGMYNDFLQSFPWAITIILGISLLVAVLLVPYMQYFFIHKGLKSNGKRKKRNFLDIMQEKYEWLLNKCFIYPKITLCIGLATVILGCIMFINLPQRLMPIAERNQFAVEFFLPKGTAIEQTAAIADSMENILRKDDRIVSVTSFIGASSPRFHTSYAPQMPGSNFAQFIVNTKSNKATVEILDEYSGKYTNYFPNALIRFKQLEYSDASSPIEIRLSGENISDLKNSADSLMQILRKVPELTLVRTNFEEQLPGVSIILDNDEANRLGISKSLVSLNMAMRFGPGVPVTTLWEKDYPIGIVLKTERSEEPQLDDINNEYQPAWGGMFSVPMRQIATIKGDWNEGQIVRRNGIPTISVLADVKRHVNVTEITSQIKEKISDFNSPEGITISFGGADESDREAIPQITGALIIAVIIIFFILLFHFKKINLALLILSSMTLCILGAAIGIWVMGLEVSITAILGIVSLMGILVRNGIIMLDYAEELRIKNKESVFDAAYHSARRRMRPIFLTSAAASMGVIPMILGKSALWSPLGTVVCFGTMISMILIITVLPVAYYMIFKKSDKKYHLSNNIE